MQEQFKIACQIWMQVWWMGTNNASKKKLWIYFSILPILGLLVGILFLNVNSSVKRGWLTIPGFFAGGVGLNLVFMMMFGFIYLCNVVRLQYSPANSKLVPHLKRHLQFAIGIPLFIFPLIALVVQSLIVQHLRIEAWAFTSIFMLSACIGIRSPFGFILFFVSLQMPSLNKHGAFKTLMASTDLKLALFVVSGLISIFILHWLFAMNEKEIYNVEKRSLSFKGLLNQNELKNTNFTSRFFNSPYLMWMNYRLSIVKKFNQNNRSSLQIFGLSPNVHWITSFFMVLSISLGMLIFFGVLELIGSGSKFEISSLSDFSRGFLSVMIPLSSLMYVFNFSMTLYSSRHEHGLLQLAPMGNNLSTHTQNRLLMLTFVKQFFTLWTMGFTLSLLIGFLVEASKTQMFVILLANLCVLFPSLAIFYKQNKRQNIHDHKVILFSLMGILLFGLSSLVLMISGEIGAWVCAISLLILYGFLVHVFWYQCMNQSTIFPAGRSA